MKHKTGESKASPRFDKFKDILFVGRKVGAPQLGYHMRAAGISHPATPVQIPSFQKTINKTSAKRITGAEDIDHLDRKSGNFLNSAVGKINYCTARPRFYNQSIDTKM